MRGSFFQRCLTAAFCLAAPAALAGDAQIGRSAFNRACASCHDVSLPTPGATTTPAPRNLALWVKGKEGPDFRRWVANPWKVKPETKCDPRALESDRVEDVLAYLRLQSVPRVDAATRQEQELTDALKTRAAQRNNRPQGERKN